MIPDDIDSLDWFLLISYVAAGYTVLWIFRPKYLVNIQSDFRILIESFLAGFSTLLVLGSAVLFPYYYLKDSRESNEALQREFVTVTIALSSVFYLGITVLRIIN